MSGDDWRAEFGKFVVALALSGITVPGWESMVSAQIIPDETLGAESSVVTPDTIKGIESGLAEGEALRVRISGGAIRGSNLFHSFREFNIGEGRGGYFENPTAIENIFSRVTGSNPSNILGTLGVLGNANLFFLNPNGILFGPNARLDLNGSFLGTTADSILFPDSKQFSAINPEAPPLLTVNVQQPIGLEFEGQGIIARIENRSTAPAGVDLLGEPLSGLRVPDGQSLVLVGGDIAIDGGGLHALGGRVELAGFAGDGTVGLSGNGSNLSVSILEGTARADVSIKNLAQINVTADNRGSIAINARNIEMAGSFLMAGIGFGLGTPDSKAGDIILNATEATIVKGSSSILNLVYPEAVGQSGNIKIEANSLSVTDFSELAAVTLGRGNAGSILLKVDGAVSLSGESNIFNSVGQPAIGTVGGITIEADSLSLTEGSELVASTLGRGDAGTVTIQVRDRVSFDGVGDDGFASGIFATVFPNAVGRGGGVTLRADSLSITDGARIQTKSEGQGNTGNVTIEVSDGIFFNGAEKNPNPAVDHLTGIFTTVETSTFQQGGNIKIETGSLSLIDGGQLTANTFGQGNSGNVIIEARGHIFFDGANSPRDRNTGVFSAVGRDPLGAVGEGQGGDIRILAESLSLNNGASIAAATSGRGNAGKVTIVAQEKVSLDGIASNGFRSEIVTSVQPEAIGNANDIDITTGLLTVTNGAQISARTLGAGKAGSIFINADTFQASKAGQLLTATSSNFDAGDITLKVRDNITLSDSNTGIFANTLKGSTGNSGNIFIDPNTVIIRDGSQIAVNSSGSGIGGDINLQAGSLTLDKGTITAEAASNQGGNINLTLSDLLTLRDNSQITATAGTAGTDEAEGDGGNITIDTPFIISSPFENNDITANASFGNGGRVRIISSGIFGIEERDDPTPLSDITASSEFGQEGEVEIDTSAIDPTRSLDNLPQEAVEAEVASGCQTVGGQSTLEFFDIGRGGLPPSPDDLFSSETVIAEWIPLDLADEKIQEQTLEKSFTGDGMKNITLLTNLSCRRN